MGSDIVSLILAPPLAAALVLLVPRHAARAWAIWLLVCLLVIGLQGVGQGLFSYYAPEKLSLWVKENQVELERDAAGEVVRVVVNDPPRAGRLGRIQQLPVGIAGGVLVLATAILVLILRAQPGEPAPKPAGTRAGRGAGLSVLMFGLVVLAGALAEAIPSRRDSVNLLGVAVIASGWYLSRGSRLGAKWALLWMALIGALCILVVVFLAAGQQGNVMGKEIQPGDAPWALALGLALVAWAAANVVLTVRFLTRTSPLTEAP